MVGFESFSVGSWLDKNVLTRHVGTPKRSLPTLKQAWQGAIIASAMAVGLSSLTAAAIAAPTSLQVSPERSSVKAHPKLGDFVPDGYWPKLMSEMKAWQTLAEPDIEYPDED